MTGDIEPLRPEYWFRRIEVIARGELGSLERSLRHAGHLLQLAPKPLRKFVGLSVDEAVFDALLEAGDLDAAARFIVADQSALTVVEEPGVVRAVIRCVALGRIVHGSGENVAAAVLNAWTTCLLALRDQYGEDLAILQSQTHHTARSESHPHSSLH